MRYNLDRERRLTKQADNEGSLDTIPSRRNDLADATSESGRERTPSRASPGNSHWLASESAAEIENGSTSVTFGKGATIFSRGAPADLIFWLRKGFVKLYLPHANGGRTLIAFARPGEPLGIVADVDAKSRNHQIFEAQA